MASVSKRKKREKIGTAVYWVFLLLYTFVLFAGVFWFLRDRWKYAEEYERAQPGHVIDDYMDNLNLTRWNDSMQSAASALANDFQTPEECCAVVKETLQGDFAKSKTALDDSTKMAYDIICNKRKIGTVYMQIDDLAVTEYGEQPWRISGDEFNFDYLLTSSTATAPASFTVKLNNVPVGEEYITETGIHYDVLEQYYSDYEGLPTKVVYDIPGLVGTVEPVIFDEFGEIFVPDTSANDSQYMVPCSQQELVILKDFMDSFINPYAQYFGTKWVDANFGALMQYVQKNSDLHNIMIGFQDGASWIHTYRIDLVNYEFKGAFALGGGFYVIQAEYETIAYADYKTVNEPSPLNLIVHCDENGIRAVAVA